MKKWDAVIIGGGHNGLVAAAYLARAGRRVLVLERRELPGGCAVTEKLWPGFQVSTGAYLVSLLRDEIVRDLHLAEFGYRVYPKDPPFFTPFPDGRHLFMWQHPERTVAEFARFSTRDAAALAAYDAYLERLAEEMDTLEFSSSPAPSAELSELLELSAEEFLDRWFESPEIKVTLATDGVIGANGGPRTPGTAYVLLHHCMGLAAGRRGLWGYVHGGMGALSEAIASAARSFGAEIRLNAPVKSILMRAGAAKGVALAGGEEIEAEAVLSNLDPCATFQRLLGQPDGRTHAWRSEGVSMKINLALDGLPDFRALPGTPGPQHRATIHLCPSVDYVERAWNDAREGRPSQNPMLEIGIPSMYDPTLAPPGKHVMSIFLQYTPYTLRDGSWDDLRDPYADRVMDVIEEYAPGFRSLILHRQVLSPLDLERRFGITGGNIFHGELAADQLFQNRFSCTTHVPGLYLCGSGTHPGGGVMGAPGYNAARAVLAAVTP